MTSFVRDHKIIRSFMDIATRQVHRKQNIRRYVCLPIYVEEGGGGVRMVGGARVEDIFKICIIDILRASFRDNVWEYGKAEKKYYWK